MDVKLRVISGPFAGQAIELKAPKFLIGRERDCHLRPDSEFVSRHHCVLLLDPYTLRVRDLGSKNGTLVNNRRIGGEVVLVHDDTLTVGDMTLHICIEQNARGEKETPQSDSKPVVLFDAANQSTDVFDGNTVSTVPDPAIQPPDPQQPPAHQPVPTPIVPGSPHQQSPAVPPIGPLPPDDLQETPRSQ